MPRYGPYDFYSGSVRLWFDSESHTYLREERFDGEIKLVPQRGVTTILKIIDKSEYLVPWAAKRTAEKMAAIMPTVDDGLDVYTKSIHLVDFLNLCDQAKKAPREILDDAGNVGTMAHEALEAAIKFAINTNKGIVDKLVTTIKDPRAQSCCAAALSWMRGHNVRWIFTERKVYSRDHEFAGTMDGLAMVDACSDSRCCVVHFTDKISLIDWKSSNYLDVNYLYQTAAYEHAYEEETKKPITDRWILRLGKIDGDFEKWHETEETFEEDFAAFLASGDLKRRHENVKFRMSQASKARTQRKRAVAKEEKLVAKEAAKAEKVAAKLSAKLAKKKP